MATQVSARNSCWLDGITVAAQDIRLGQNSASLTSASAAGTTGIAAAQGVRYGVGSPLACTWTSGMAFTLNAGMCWVQGTAAANAGLYGLVLDTTTTLTVTTSDPTNPRIDSVIAVVVDNGNNTSTFVFKILAGTPAGSPVPPTLPANSLLLCSIAVGANVVTLSSGVFTDKRVWTVASGGILPYGSAAIGTAVGGPTGSYVDDLNTGRLRRLDSSGNARQPKTGAFPPVYSSISSATGANGSYTLLESVSVTVDGLTEIEVSLNWQAAFAAVAAAVGDRLIIALGIDSAAGGPWLSQPQLIFSMPNTVLSAQSGGSFTAWAVPSAGTHTIRADLQSLQANTYQLTNASLRVGPSVS